MIPVFSPDSEHLAYGAWTGTEAVIVVDGVPIPAQYSAFPSAAGIAFDAPNRFHIVARRGNELLRVAVEIAPRRRRVRTEV